MYTAKSFSQMLADVADNEESIGFDEGVRLTRAMHNTLGGSLEEIVELILQHYRHPARMTRETLFVAAAWESLGKE